MRYESCFTHLLGSVACTVLGGEASSLGAAVGAAAVSGDIMGPSRAPDMSAFMPVMPCTRMESHGSSRDMLINWR